MGIRGGQKAINFMITYTHDRAGAITALQGLEKLQAGSRRAGNEFVKMAKRAALTIPTWLIMRKTLMMVVQTITLGVKYWIDYESALARAAAVTTVTTMDMGKAMDILGAKAEEFGRAHAGTAKDVIEAYYRMATSGMEFEDALAAAIPAVKLAVATYGDIAQTGKTVSAIFRMLGDTMDDVSGRAEKMDRIVDVLAVSWTDNEIEINELSQAIANFGTQAKRFNISFTQTIALLATSHQGLIKAGRAGRLMSRVFDDMAKSTDYIGKLLNKTFRPEEIVDWYGVLRDLISYFNELGMGSTKAIFEMQNIFNIRSRREFTLLVNLVEKLDKNMKDFGPGAKGMAEALLAIRDATPEVQMENVRENLNMLMREFLMGISESNSFVEALTKMNKALSEMGLNARLTGMAIVGMFRNIQALWRLFLVAPKLLKDKPAQENLGNSVDKFVQNFALGVTKFFGGDTGKIPVGLELEEDVDKEKFMEVLRRLTDEALKDAISFEAEAYKIGKKYYEMKAELARQYEEEREKERKKVLAEIISTGKLDKDVQMKLDLGEQELKYLNMQIAGYKEIDIAYEKLVDYATAVVERLKEQEPELLTSELLTAMLAKNWVKVLDLTGNTIIDEKELVKVQKKVNDIIMERVKLIQEYAAELRTTVTGALKDLLMGGEIDNFFLTIGDKIRENIVGSFSEGLSTQIFESTGMDKLFGGIFADVESLASGRKSIGGSIVSASNKGSNLYLERMVKGGYLAANAMASAMGNVGDFGAMGTDGAAAGALAGIGGMSKYLSFMNKPMWSGYEGPTELQHMDTSPVPSAYGPAGPSWGAGIGAVGGTAMSAYSAYQTGGALGATMAGVGTAAMAASSMGLGAFGATGAIGGAAAGTAMAALGTIIPVLGLVLAIGSMFVKKTPPKWTQEQTSEQTQQIASRIDVTNSELQWVNRNLVSLRQEISYILPKSSYFKERGTNELFSIDSRRGIS